METTRTSHAEIGVSVEHPADWSVNREQAMLAGTYGLQLWKPRESPQQQCCGIPAARVAVVPDLTPDQIDQTVQEKLDAYSDHLPVSREEMSVGVDGLEGVAIGPIPGSMPSYEVYVAFQQRVYLIRVYGEELDASGKHLISNLEFSEPSQPLDPPGLLDAHGSSDSPSTRLVERERTAQAERLAARPPEAAALTVAPAQSWEPRVLDPATVPIYDEYRIAEGCWRAESTFFVQTQHGRFANSRWGDAYTGWTIAGRPNYWDNYTHGRLGFGRCISNFYTNDKFAIDYPLAVGDVVFCPFESGTVVWWGRWDTHINYGIMVVIRARARNGHVYVSMSAHLSGVNTADVYLGAPVTDETIIGYAGATGDPSIPVGESHLHQAYYRDPNYISTPYRYGPPYGGQGLQVVYHHFVGDAREAYADPGEAPGPGVYTFTWQTHYPNTSPVASNGRYWISN